MVIIESLMYFFDIMKEDADAFLSHFRKVELQKNDVFIERGRVCHTIGLIETGLMKCVFDKDGVDIVFEFAFENSFISDYYSYVTRTASDKQIICMEDTTVYVIERTKLDELGGQYPFVETMSRKMNEYLFLKMHDKVKSLLLDTPYQRYKHLIEDRQDLASRIPQYLLASYLNVTPETISRIRKKISLEPGS
ncbi:cAMP-binding domain of CRP or a regulatory subunit of cAMP-dependent protein kinases [Chitinophaga sp. YR573]|uniref:Crp/Fnr family transcriptional regulator n=1 Tax=Chitinophaga sp. YR573 TaxID=1881040 RepID=UPI0008B92B2F|nr:Crp/Fnr family transcriptional regulator [Chitinophaga sp. YR573]SEW05117.1 cAMP-binding domain of CRP or a regulatory subunit of cAMP-dependent protein kinases [Chitinophaga sp. YR573]